MLCYFNFFFVDYFKAFNTFNVYFCLSLMSPFLLS